tara:strand:- start:84 stop:599 length:516 start_codon:yes stop_codon:yes gene_type:complete
MKLEKNVMYSSSLENVSIGSLTKEQILLFLGNGRQCGVLLETEIANKFEDVVVPETQGASADLVDDVIGTIQAKTYHAGVGRLEKKKIFTTKSGLWDSMKRRRALGEDVDKMIVDYFDDYDTFMYIDISKMKTDLSYRFIIIDSEHVKNTHEDGRISEELINSLIEREETV